MSTRKVVFWGLAVVNALVLMVLAWVHAVAGPLPPGFEAVTIVHFVASVVAVMAATFPEDSV